ncbi:MAG TPA: SprT family zinc-dependent metalloprotease [Thiolinea sp.]|nr:SprT family zinc-dependent metalloprotease [Thiolinea sp.]
MPMPTDTRLQLPDGREITIRLQTSARNKYMRLSFSPQTGLRVSGPSGCTPDQLLAFARKQNAKIMQWLQKAGTGRPKDTEADALPQRLELHAIRQTLHIKYRAGPGQTLTLLDQGDTLVLEGPIDKVEACQALLRHWLLKTARLYLSAWLAQTARQTGLHYSKLTIRNQRSRWGSCSTNHAISLNAKLLFLPPALVHYVLVHELCHTVHPDHSPAFWTLVRGFVPKLERIKQQLKQPGQWVPDWV